MSIQLIRENMEMERISGEGSVQALIEGGVMLPNPTREASVLYADARLELGNIEVQQDRVALDGQAFFTLLYTAGEDGEVRSVETALSFSHILDVPEAGPKMGVEVQGQIQHVEAEIIGGKAILRAVAALRARAEIVSSLACISDIEGVDELQTLSSVIKSLRTVARGEGHVSLDERFELPFGLESRQALHACARARIESVAALEDCIRIYGTALVDVYHSTELFDRPIARTRHDLPFELTIDAVGCEAGLPAQADVEIRDLLLTLDQMEEERYLTISLTLSAKARAQDIFEAETLVDAYSAGDEELLIKAERVTTRTGVLEQAGEDTFKASITLKDGQSPIGAVLGAFVRPAMWEINSDTRTYAEGVLEVCVLYQPAGGGRPMALNEEMPFRVSYDFILPEDNWSSLYAVDTEAIQITGERLELKCLIALSARAYEHEDLTVSLDAEVAEGIDPVPGGVTLYFVQPGDTLWSVAKNFRTTKETLLRFNPETTELTGTEKILLYKRVTNA